MFRVVSVSGMQATRDSALSYCYCVVKHYSYRPAFRAQPLYLAAPCGPVAWECRCYANDAHGRGEKRDMVVGRGVGGGRGGW